MNISLMYLNLNGDGNMNILDPMAVRVHYGAPGGSVYDVNGDGKVDEKDALVFNQGNQIFDQ